MANPSPESRTFTRRQLLGLALTAAGSVAAEAVLTACKGKSPAVESVSTPVAQPNPDVSSKATTTPTSISTKEASPTLTTQSTATLERPTKVPVPEKRYSEFYQTAFAREMEADVDGIKVKVTIGLMSNITERAAEPVTYFEPSNQAAVNEVGRFWLKMCAYNYMVNHSEFGNPEEGSNFDNFFPKYEEMVKKGEGNLTLSGVDETKTKDRNKREVNPWQVSPTNVVLIFSDARLPVVLTQGDSAYLGRNSRGQLVLGNTMLAYGLLKEQDNFCKSSEECLLLRESVFSMCVPAGLSIVGAGRNDILFRGAYPGSGVQYEYPNKVREINDAYVQSVLSSKERTFFRIKQ